MSRNGYIIIASLIAANMAFYAWPQQEPAVAGQFLQSSYIADSVPAEPAGPGGWHEVADFPLELAKRLGPWSVSAKYTYDSGAMAVIHNVDGEYYRIYTIGGNVYYMIWYTE